MNKNNIYNFIKQITPPLIFNFLISNKFYPLIRKISEKILPSKYNPEWKKIENGLLKGREIYVTKDSTIDLMFEELHDDFMFKFISKNDIVFDIGAHIGSNSMCFSQIVGEKGKIFSFEPNPFNIKLFKKNLGRNEDLKKNIEILDLAISNKKGTESFLFTDNIEGGTSSGSFIENADTFWSKEVYEKEAGFKRMEVEADTLDNFVIENNIIPNVIKIDVEGAENLVLDGGLKTITEHKPLILVEIHSIFNMFKVLNCLKEADYKVEIISKEKDGRCFLMANFK